MAVVSVVFPPRRRAQKYKKSGKAQNQEGKKAKGDPNKYIVSNEEEKTRVPCFSQCCPEFSLCPNETPLDPSEKMKPLRTVFWVVRRLQKKLFFSSLALFAGQRKKERRKDVRVLFLLVVCLTGGSGGGLVWCPG